MIWRCVLEGKLSRKDADDMYLEDIADHYEGLDVWADVNNLDVTSPAPANFPPEGRKVVQLPASFFDRVRSAQ